MKNKGISLIVLIITIIIIIILSTVIFLTISRNNPVNSANEAVFKEDIRTFQTELEIYKTNMKIDDEDPTKLNATKETEPSIQDIIQSMTNKYAKILEIREGELVYVGEDKATYRLAYNMEILPKDELLDDDILEELQPFITEWTVEAGDTITLPIAGTNKFTVDYGDGTGEISVNSTSDENKNHTYENAGTYTVTIKGKSTNFGEGSGTKDKLTRIVQWGNIGFTRVNFSSCSNLKGPIPGPVKNTFANVTSLGGLFRGCKSLNGPIPEKLFANCPKVTAFDFTFYQCSGLTGEIPENLFANCTNVTSFQNTFTDCKNLTGNAPALWERTNVTSYSNCFSNCKKLSNYSEIPSAWGGGGT